LKAEIVMIGTELLLGELVDTNANLLAKSLREIGLDLYYKTTVGDNENRITEVLNLALDRSDVIITSGGLGPTVDDVTRQAVANATGRRLIYSADFELQIAERFRNFGREMAENNKRQAYIPEGATPLTNPVGTAPCFLSEDIRGRGFVISLPGVPRELEFMMNNTVIPLLIERMGGKRVMRVRILRTCAVGESNVDQAISDLMTTKNPTVGLAAHAGQTDVRITAKGETASEADNLIASMEKRVRGRLGIAIYGTEKETVPEVVGKLLVEHQLNLGVIDTLTEGRLVRDLVEAGFGKMIHSDLSPPTLEQAAKAFGFDWSPHQDKKENHLLASSIAERVAPTDGIGLALLGPFEDNSTLIALNGPGDSGFVKTSRNFQDSDWVRRWLVTQGLDWIRRAVIGELNSPADWN